MTSLNHRIKIARNYANLTQQALCDSIDISIRALKNYEKDATKVTVRVVQNIALACKVNESWLFTGDGEMTKGITSFKKAANSDASDEDPILQEHFEIVRQFEDKETAKEMNKHLREIEMLDKSEFKDVAGYLRGVASVLKKSKQRGRMGGKKAVNGK